MPVGTALGGFSVFSSLSMIATQTVKQGKHNAIMLLAQGNLDSIADIISQARQDGDLSPTDFHKVLQKKEKYCRLKADIRNWT